jgi:hypothetical protein
VCLKVMNEGLERCGPAIGYLASASELKGVSDLVNTFYPSLRMPVISGLIMPLKSKLSR